MSVNRVILVGRVCGEPETRSFANGGSICNLRIVTNESWKDKQTGERKERSEFHRVALRGKLGEIAQQYLHKGSQVYLEGSIVTRKWQDQNGEDKYATDIVCNQMTMLDSKSSQSGNGQPNGNYQQRQAGNNVNGNVAPQDDFIEDDIPF